MHEATATSSNAATERSDEAAIDAMREYAHQLRAFQAHAAVAAASIALIFVVNLTTNLSAGIAGQWSAWWSIWALVGWSAGLAVHGLVVRLNRVNGPAHSSVSERS